jgi:hypothetical protein
MGVWGWHPAESDDAADFMAGVRAVLDDAVTAAVAAADRAAALEVLAIATPLAAAGMHALGDDADDALHRLLPLAAFADHDRALAEPRGRPGFAGEGGVERWLREAGAPYDVWMRAAEFGDDVATAFHACGDIHGQLAFARAAGLDDAAQVRALATALLALPAAAALSTEAGSALASAAATGKLAPHAAADLVHAGATAYHAWVEERQAAIAGARPPPPMSAETALAQIAGELARKPTANFDRFVDALPELPAELARALAPVVIAAVKT